jgi:superfamily II DNA or RNA helicase
MSDGQPELVDNQQRYVHAEALRWLAERYPRPLRLATGYVRLNGLHTVAQLPGPADRSVRILLGAVPEPGLGEDSLLEDEARRAGMLLERALQRLRQERDFDAFPPSRRLQALQAVDEFLTDERVLVRRFTERFLHGKSYIFADDPGKGYGEPGAALVTSANLTGGGLEGNLELGLVHYQPHVVADAARWFDDLWERAAEFKEELRELLFPEVPQYSPQIIFLRMLLELYGEELEETVAPAERPTLARFQEDGYRRALRTLEKYGGVIYADGVGTGKTHIGLEFIRRYAGEKGLHTLIVAPAQLRDETWQRALHRANLPGQVISYQELAMDEQLAPRNGARRRVLAVNKDAYRLVIVDEAHAFRSPDTTYYYALDRLLGGTPKALLLLTATPVNNALWDIYHQIMLFARHDAAFADPLAIRDLRAFFRDAGANDPDLISPTRLFPLIDAVAVRRDRNFLEKHYAGDTFPDGTPVRFPKPLFQERRYDLDQAYPGIFQRIVRTIGDLKMARYQPSRYLKVDARADGREAALAGLIQSGLLKRFESSVHAANETVSRVLAVHEALIRACEEHGQVPSVASLRALFAEVHEGEVPPEAVEDLLQQDEDARPTDDFTEAFLDDLKADRDALAAMRDDLAALLQQEDTKLAALLEILRNSPAEKIAIFTAFGDTARYLKRALEGDEGARGGRPFIAVIGDEASSKEREHGLVRFCPRSMTDNPDYRPADGEVDLLLATDIVSEGQNLQDAQAVISYDMPWNPQRVVQRNGRVIRLKSQHTEVYLHTLLPKRGDLEELLRLEARLRAKIAAANASVGMESQVLAAIEAESRAYADLKEFADRLADGDTTLLEEGEGGQSGSFIGEQYRAMLARAQAEGQLPELKAMPWGVGSCFRATVSLEGASLPAIVFAARDRSGGRHWRAVAADGAVLRDDLELLKLADPADEPREELPDSVDLDALWQIAVEDICAEHNAALDPAARERRLPASQRWALDLLRDPSLPDRPEFSEADGALLVPRDAAVLRSLADIRRRLQAEELTPLQAAEGIATVVQEFGLRPAKVAEAVGRPLTPGDIGVVVYQVVFGEK